ncbi:MAG: TolC family protein, partial [Chitinophagaceae bacterium]
FQAQIDVNTRLQDYQAQELVLQQAKVALAAAINIVPTTAIQVSDTIIVDKKIKLDSVLVFVQQNPAILAAKQQVIISELLEKETATLKQPSVRANVGTNYNRNQSTGGQLLLNQSYGPFVSVGVALPLYNGGVVKRQQKTASFTTKNAGLQKDQLMQDFTANIVRTYDAYLNTIQQIETQSSTFQISQKLVELMLQKFQMAQATIVDVREAQRSFEEAGYRLVNLNYAAKLAEIELKRLANKLQF